MPIHNFIDSKSTRNTKNFNKQIPPAIPSHNNRNSNHKLQKVFFFPKLQNKVHTIAADVFKVFNRLMNFYPKKEKKCCYSYVMNKQAKEKHFSIAFSYGSTQKKTVMVILSHTRIQKPAVFRPLWSFDLTSRTNFVRVSDFFEFFRFKGFNNSFTNSIVIRTWNNSTFITFVYSKYLLH